MTDATKRWKDAVLGGFISGGSSSVTATAVTSMMDPKDFGLHSLAHTLLLFAATFTVTGLVSVAKYLRNHPLPGVDIPDAT